MELLHVQMVALDCLVDHARKFRHQNIFRRRKKAEPFWESCIFKGQVVFYPTTQASSEKVHQR